MILSFGRVASLSLFPCLEIIGLLDPSSLVRLMASTWSLPDRGWWRQCLLGGPGSPYFQSSYPCLIVGAISWFTLPSSPLALTFSLPPHAPRHHIPPISAHVFVVPPLTDNVKHIDSGLCFSFPLQVHPVPLDVLPSLLSSCLQKQEIIQNDL